MAEKLSEHQGPRAPQVVQVERERHQRHAAQVQDGGPHLPVAPEQQHGQDFAAHRQRHSRVTRRSSGAHHTAAASPTAVPRAPSGLSSLFQGMLVGSLRRGEPGAAAANAPGGMVDSFTWIHITECRSPVTCCIESAALSFSP